jgi:hypothetical protein
MRFQPRAPQQAFQLLGRQRMLDVIHAFKFHALCSQDTLDLAACASRRLLVKSDFGFLFHGRTTLSPLRGCARFVAYDPGLAPWAVFLCRFAAESLMSRDLQHNLPIVLAFFEQPISLHRALEWKHVPDLRNQLALFDPLGKLLPRGFHDLAFLREIRQP